MYILLGFSRFLDNLLAFFGKIGALCGVLLAVVVCIDVATRYLNIPKPFGWNSTQLQESEYWLHTFLFTFMIGWAYTQQKHVRIDLVSSILPYRIRLFIELVGLLFFLLTFSLLGMWFSGHYAYSSILENETSKSALGLPNIWILKSSIFIMFLLMAFSAISQFIKVLAALMCVTSNGRIIEPFKGDS